MRQSMITLLYLVLLASAPASADSPILVVTDTDGAAARVAAPVSVDVDLTTAFRRYSETEPLQLVEQTDKSAQEVAPVAVQFVPALEGGEERKALVADAARSERPAAIPAGDGREAAWPGPAATFRRGTPSGRRDRG